MYCDCILLLPPRKASFSTKDFKKAQKYVKNIDSKIILIDGDQLAQFMIDSNVGVSPVAVYEVKRIDSDYFTDE